MVFTYQGSLYLDRYMELPLSELRAADPAAPTENVFLSSFGSDSYEISVAHRLQPECLDTRSA